MDVGFEERSAIVWMACVEWGRKSFGNGAIVLAVSVDAGLRDRTSFILTS